jgi:hypothetical protein
MPKKIYQYTNDQLNAVIDLVDGKNYTLMAACRQQGMDYPATRNSLNELGYLLPRKPNKINADVVQTISTMFDKGYTFKEIAQKVNLSEVSVLKALPKDKREWLKNAPAYVRFKKRPLLGLTAARVLGISYEKFVEQATESYAKTILEASRK